MRLEHFISNSFTIETQAGVQFSVSVYSHDYMDDIVFPVYIWPTDVSPCFSSSFAESPLGWLPYSETAVASVMYKWLRQVLETKFPPHKEARQRYSPEPLSGLGLKAGEKGEGGRNSAFFAGMRIRGEEVEGQVYLCSRAAAAESSMLEFIWFGREKLRVVFAGKSDDAESGPNKRTKIHG